MRVRGGKVRRGDRGRVHESEELRISDTLAKSRKKNKLDVSFSSSQRQIFAEHEDLEPSFFSSSLPFGVVVLHCFFQYRLAVHSLPPLPPLAEALVRVCVSAVSLTSAFLHAFLFVCVSEREKKESGPSQSLKFMFSVCQLRAALPNICNSFSLPSIFPPVLSFILLPAFVTLGGLLR